MTIMDELKMENQWICALSSAAGSASGLKIWALLLVTQSSTSAFFMSLFDTRPHESLDTAAATAPALTRQ